MFHISLVPSQLESNNTPFYALWWEQLFNLSTEMKIVHIFWKKLSRTLFSIILITL